MINKRMLEKKKKGKDKANVKRKLAAADKLPLSADAAIVPQMPKDQTADSLT